MHPDKPDEFIAEVVKFSAQVVKINERGARQDRHLVCTDWQLHHFKTRARDADAAASSSSDTFVADPGDYREAQRSVPLRCLTECVVSTASLQVVVQVRAFRCCCCARVLFARHVSIPLVLHAEMWLSLQASIA